MASGSRQPAGSVSSVYRCKLDRILQSSLLGTPYTRSNRRRIGSLGSTTKNKNSLLNAGATSRSRRYSGEKAVTHRARRSEAFTEVENLNVKELKGKAWKVFRVTPLYNFQTKKSDFQYYSRCLSAHIAAEAKRGTFIDTTTPDDAVVGHFIGLNVGDNDPKALLIDVKGKTNKGNVQVVSQAVLFTTDLEFNPLKPLLQDEFTYFACMIVRGPVVHTETIQNWVEVQFDCRVIPQSFTSLELGFMAAMFTGLVEGEKSLELVYNIPNTVEGLSSITYSTRAEDCKRLWNAIKSSDADGLTDLEASKFMEGLESHFYGCCGIKLSTLPLATIQTAAAFVSRQGQVKLSSNSPDEILKVLRHFTDLALDQLKTV